MITELFNKPKVIGIIGNVNEGKSNLIYYLLEELNKIGKFNLFVYGLRNEISNSIKVHSIKELEQIRNSIVILDEIGTLFDFEDRRKRKQIENTIRLINHNNNVLLLCGTPENFKKFLSAKVDYFIFKKVLFSDFINGSRSKNIVLDYKGYERGTEVLDLNIDEALVYDGLHYYTIKIKYMKPFDTKRDNEPIIKCSSNCGKSVSKKVENENKN